MKTVYILNIFLHIYFIVPSKACRNGEIIVSGLTADEQRVIIQTHNELRQKVAMGQISGQPAAQNMAQIEWDANLARRAQEWANQCIYDHDPYNYDDRFNIGQNLAIMWSSNPLSTGDFQSRIQKWFDEVTLYSWGQGWTSRTGHYSQMIWAQTTLIGCGYSYYKTAGQYKKLYVCNYAPGGNVAGRLPYQPGYPVCDSYGMTLSAEFPGLCKSDEYENVIRGVHYKSAYSPYANGWSRQFVPGKYKLPKLDYKW